MTWHNLQVLQLLCCRRHRGSYFTFDVRNFATSQRVANNMFFLIYIGFTNSYMKMSRKHSFVVTNLNFNLSALDLQSWEWLESWEISYFKIPLVQYLSRKSPLLPAHLYKSKEVVSTAGDPLPTLILLGCGVWNSVCFLILCRDSALIDSSTPAPWFCVCCANLPSEDPSMYMMIPPSYKDPM